MDPAEKKRAWFGWCMYDWANSGFATVVMAAVFPVYFTTLVPPGGAEISLAGLHRTVPPAALWAYLVALSMLLVTFSTPYLGALGDHRGTRRRFLIGFTLAGATATALLVLAGPGDYLLAAALFIVANFSFAAANVFYNAFLPALAREEGEIDRLSARGFAAGYIGGGLLLLLVFLMIRWPGIFGLSDPLAATRSGLLLTGLWWGLFALPTFLLLREEVLPRPPARLLAGFRGYLRTFAEIRRYRDLLTFLAAFLLYNDGIQTVIVVSAVFAKEELGLSQGTILGVFLMIQFLAMPGTLFFGWLAGKAGAKRTIFLTLVLFVAVVLYAYAMESALEFWVLGALVALIFGGSQAISRSLYGTLLPPGKSAEFFGFYAISNKFASVLGPFTFGLLADLTGSNRLSILAIAGFFLAGMTLLALVDVPRGKAAARGAMS